MVCIAVIAVVLRLRYLAQPMRYDEAVTYMYFVRRPWSDALSLYLYPNNHLLHTLLAKASVSAFGNSPWTLRLPAFFAGALVVPATYAVARAIYGARAALFAAAIVAASGVLVLYSTNARGYSLIVLAFLLLALVAIRLWNAAAPSLWITFAIIAAAGMWAVPVMLYPLGAVALWIALTFLIEERRPELRRLVIALGVAGGLTLLAYAPVISREGIAAITRNKFVASSNWFEFFEQLPSSIGDALVSWGLGIPPLVSLALLAFAVVALRRHAKLSRLPVGLALAAYVWSSWLLVVNHRAPFPRVWLWLFPLVAMLAAAGVVAMLERRPRTARFLELRAPAIAVAFAVGAATSVVLSRAVLLTRDTGTFRDAEQASLLLSRTLRSGDLLLAPIPANAPLAYYLARLGVDSTHLTLDERLARRVIVVLDGAEPQPLDRIIEQSEVRDSTRFAGPQVLARLPYSTLLMFQRKDVSPNQ